MRTRTGTFMRDNNAVSEVIGEVLMTAIAVLAFSVIAVFVFSSMGTSERIYANIDGWVDVASDTINVRHSGGEYIDLNNMEIILNLNGTRRELSSSQVVQMFGNDSLHPGEIITIDTDVLWNTTIHENDYVGMILLQKDSNTIVESGSLLGDETGLQGTDSGSGSGPSDADNSSAPESVAWWKFDEGTGSIAYDIAGSNDAYITDGHWENNGINGTAIRFDGNTAYLAVNDHNSLDFDRNMSILLWLKLRKNDDFAIIGKGQDNLDNFDLFVKSGELYFEWNESNSNYVRTTGMNLQTNTWYQIGVVADGINVSFYKDGLFTEAHSMNGVPLAPNNNELWIGRQNYAGNDLYLNGYLDEIELYNTTLSQADITDYYTRTNP